MQIASIIPVKTFSRAKSRLGLSQEKTEELCKVMLEEVLSAISKSQISKTIIISKDEAAFEIAKKYDTIQIFEEKENGVNAAVALSEKYLLGNNFDASIVFPQDIPLIRPQDIDELIKLQKTPQVIVVPSRKFDGTNALLRSPIDIMETHYDEDSYKIHLSTAKSKNIPVTFALISRIMWDVDDKSDIGFIMSNIEKPALAEKLRNLL
ncbi:MAG: 2-phospho-L-lactate guanylyltransferase [Nitrososphaeria archaeon]|nr:2-phospho-L-lactate guanylyltransferase [Nitrososphaeria archaeon]NDB51306.1 2-phospho-L-lactate guanylyltransferase [Nitrosopumilaceae archaeon]NDB88777.1 2-phospho-L-lactate guanylyltransferase [Nitrososphaerota archaeon]NDB45920.1 2-phospho-L-lactate guanylyltransferase [Nitrososphaeria archaeon]NDB63117.1 2-phospho-L-lactate guanylyltransferase [Nitrosopumilaceae archaeon]